MIATDEEKVKEVLRKILLEEDYPRDKYSIEINLKPLLEQENSFPTSILRSEQLSSLEAIVKYLRENKKLQYKKIGELLQRNHKTLAVTYKNAIKKQPAPFASSVEREQERIEFFAFNNKLSVLEAITLFLKKQDKNFSEISRLLGKDPRTIWTVHDRAMKKLGGRNK